MTLLIQNLDYVVSFACLIFALHMLRLQSGNRMPARLLGLCFVILALQAALLYLISIDGRPSLPAALLPAMPLIFGPALFLFFKSAADPTFKFRLIHALFLVPALFVLVLMGSQIGLQFVDYTIFLSHLGYALALMHLAHRGVSYFERAGVYAVSIHRWLMLGAAYSVIMFFADLLIYLEIEAGGSANTSLSLLFTLVFKLAVIAFMLLMALQNSPYFEWIYSVGAAEKSSEESALAVSNQELYADIIQGLTHQLAAPNFYENAPPTVKEMAYRLGVPIRSLSKAVNHTYGESYSRYMNRQRVERAKVYIDDNPAAAMIDVMYEAGFRTKSSFNKEFKVFEGMSPTEYRSRVRG